MAINNIENVIADLKRVDSKYKSLPFWSWNGELDEERLVKQVEWMNEHGIGGFFMHARGGLTTDYLGEKWFDCVRACSKRAEELGMNAWAYDENGWPSGFAGGKLLEDIENHDKYITHTLGAFDATADASYFVGGDELVRVKESASNGDYLNIFIHYSPSTADVLNPEVVDKFIALTHDKYKSEMGEAFSKELRGFFTDEPQYFRWGVSYTNMIAKYFRTTYGEDILDKLGLLFVKKRGYASFRYKYWKGMQYLFLENFSKKIYEWCDKNGVKLTGHYVEESSLGGQMMCNGGVMPYYEYEHIPGVDWLGRPTGNAIEPKQIGSACAQLGKKQVLTESFALTGWEATPAELKAILEWQYVYGVNLLCQHLLPYSETGQRKRDYPQHFSEVNPWTRTHFKQFNDYFSRLGCLVSESREECSVAMLHPIRSAYIDYDRTKPEFNLSELEKIFLSETESLENAGISFHYLDETLLAKYGEVRSNKLKMGKCEYDAIVIPTSSLMDSTTEKLLAKYCENGGKVLLMGEKPTMVEGEPFDFSYLVSNTTIEELTAKQLNRISTDNKKVKYCVREYNGKKFFFIVNTSAADCAEITISAECESFDRLIIEDLSTVKVGKALTLKPFESALLFFGEGSFKQAKEFSSISLGSKWKAVAPNGNYLTLDTARLSYDGVKYGDELYVMGIFQELLKSRYEGDIYLKYVFSCETVPQKIALIAEDQHCADVSINGVNVRFDGVSDFAVDFLKGDLTPFVKLGENEIIIKLRFYEKPEVYDVLFGNATESLKNCLAYTMTLESVYLIGDFGVFAKKAMTFDCQTQMYRGENFYLGKAKEEITDLVTDGYPFFAGVLELEQRFNATDICGKIKLDGRYSAADIFSNGAFVKTLLFDDEIELDGLLKVGENTLKAVVSISNRNLFGPHHASANDCKFVCPDTFERFGKWKEGRCDCYLDGYYFVRCGFFAKNL